MPSIDNLTPSSSLMLVRDSCDGIQVFMMKRAQKSNFGGIWVFPGGIIENQDKEIAEKDFCKGLTESDAKGILNNDNESLHYWIASLRETFEESGALIANREDNSVFVPTDDELGTLEKLRNDLLNGNISFMSILIQLNLKIDLSRLIYVSHWITPNVETKRYTTRFFLTSLNEDMALRHDGIEGTDSNWFGINDLLKDYENGKVSLIMPTIKNLESITNFANTDELMSAKKNINPKDIPAIEPKFFIENGKWRGLLPGEDGYEDH